MELYERFAPLMAQALHCSTTQEGLELPLTEIKNRLLALATEERSRHLALDRFDAEPDFKSLMENARFAVYAFVDEKLLNSLRPDAQDWMALSLQCHFANTTQGGRLFFTRLGQILDSLGIEREKAEKKLDLAERLVAASQLDLNTNQNLREAQVLKVFCLCLLYGFKGALYEQTALLDSLRIISEKILRQKLEIDSRISLVKLNSRVSSFKNLTFILYILLPIIVFGVFWWYCGSLLSQIPVKIF